MFTINPQAARNDYRVASAVGTIVVTRKFDASTGVAYWIVSRNVHAGHKDASTVYARRVASFEAADAIARAEAERA